MAFFSDTFGSIRDAAIGLLSDCGVDSTPKMVAAGVGAIVVAKVLSSAVAPPEPDAAVLAALPPSVRGHVEEIKKKLCFMYHHVRNDYFSEDGLNVQVPRNAVIVDVGGHMGLFSLQCFIRSGLTAKIFTFEPIPQNRKILLETVAGLGPTKDNIRVFPYGLSDRPGKIQFDYVPRASALSSCKKEGRAEVVAEVLSPEFLVRNYYENPVYQYMNEVPSIFKWLPRFIGAPLLRFLLRQVLDDAVTATVPVECELRTLSSVLATENVGPRIDLLKVDVEGAELDVVRGISKEDWSKIQAAAIEVGAHDGNLEPIRDILIQNGLTDIIETQEDDFKSMGVWLLNAKRP